MVKFESSIPSMVLIFSNGFHLFLLVYISSIRMLNGALINIPTTFPNCVFIADANNYAGSKAFVIFSRLSHSVQENCVAYNFQFSMQPLWISVVSNEMAPSVASVSKKLLGSTRGVVIVLKGSFLTRYFITSAFWKSLLNGGVAGT